jgi:hypothetical protein
MRDFVKRLILVMTVMVGNLTVQYLYCSHADKNHHRDMEKYSVSL